MSGSGSVDDDLLARLNALKKSSVNLDTTYSSSIARSPKHTDDLASRFARLGSASPSGSPQPSRTASANNVIAPGAPSYLEGAAQGVGGGSVEFNEEDEKSLEELLEELNGAVGHRKEWDMSREEQGDVGKLLKDMKTLLPELQNDRAQNAAQRQPANGKGKGEALTDWENVEFDVGSGSVGPKRDEEDSGSDNEDGEGKKQTLEAEADDVIARIMAELEISKKYDPPSPPPPYSDRDPEQPNAEKSTEDHTEDTSLSLPSAPTTLKPSDSLDETQALEDAFTARLAALAGPKTDSLGLPSAPSFAPSAKPPKVQSSLQQKLDEEIDTWCIICQDDATLKCLGCEGDLYCRNCWMEGHKGESAGFEERSHKAVEFVKGGDKKKRLAAAG
ncbi:hypothetical protein C7974DRAFT_391324 [Boeremia exigua]|uniref:uncharacterized protein n=1 Tax=Boeremia exigua TaxID=749465 RepID=UPI001E8D6E7B|nr:uncharacterized protein C7974DRAFT_391324 [Boeremia exigua]KAH6638317.1 hypothetical protein C7974DRAFT_391324 [Boeremia exigua]